MNRMGDHFGQAVDPVTGDVVTVGYDVVRGELAYWFNQQVAQSIPPDLRCASASPDRIALEILLRRRQETRQLLTDLGKPRPPAGLMLGHQVYA